MSESTHSGHSVSNRQKSRRLVIVSGLKRTRWTRSRILLESFGAHYAVLSTNWQNKIRWFFFFSQRIFAEREESLAKRNLRRESLAKIEWKTTRRVRMSMCLSACATIVCFFRMLSLPGFLVCLSGNRHCATLCVCPDTSGQWMASGHLPPDSTGHFYSEQSKLQCVNCPSTRQDRNSSKSHNSNSLISTVSIRSLALD